MENILQNEEEDEYNLLSGSGIRTKKSKSKTKTDVKFFLKFISVLLVIHAYFLQNYLHSEQAVTTIRVLNNELNITTIEETISRFTFNTQREMIFNPNRKVFN